MAIRNRDRNAILNAVAHTLLGEYGPLPLSVRYGAAEAAVTAVEAWQRDEDRPVIAPRKPPTPKPDPGRRD